MIELKTLKDFENKIGTGNKGIYPTWQDENNTFVKDIFKELKAEAVKEVKELLSNLKDGEGRFKLPNGKNLYQYAYECSDISAVITYIKWKFNLTEEDLKEVQND